MTARVVEALIQTGSVETPYWRAGQGAPVLLLMPAGASPPPLFFGLAESFRVTAPRAHAFTHSMVPEHAEPASAWLRGILEGLGLDRPDLVAHPVYAGFVERFATSDADRVGRTVLVPEGDDLELGRLVQWLTDQLGRGASPVTGGSTG